MRVLAVLFFLAACGAAPQLGTEAWSKRDFNAALAGCCAGGKTYPDWLVEAVESSAMWVIPLARGTKLRAAYLEDKPEAQAVVLDGARVLDLVMIANKSRLSGSGGEGYFGHSALYLGGEADMRALGLWDDPLLEPHRALFAEGAVSIEAIDGGVRLSAPGQLFEADAAALFRARPLGKSRKRQVIRWLLAQIGQPFDERFELEDRRAYYCTELIYAALPEMDLPVTMSYGRKVVWPDEVVTQSLIGVTGFRFKRYVRAGKTRWQVGSRRAMATRVLEAWTPN